MKPRFALLAAAVLTTFVLVLAGAIIARLAQPSPAELAVAADSGITAIPTAAGPATSDEQYQQQLAEAAARLAQANQQLEQAYAQQTPPADQAPPAAPGSAISAERAAALALAAVPDATLLAPPELVDFSGTIGYEVRLDRGLVYVDATSGAILANGAAAPPPAEPPALIGGEQAAAVALAYVGGGTIKKIELEQEDGVTVYEVRFESGSRVYVDATSGRVIYARTEDRGHSGGSDDDDDDDK